MGYVTRPSLFYGWFVIRRLGFDAFYFYAKFDDSSLSRSRDIVGSTKKFKWVT